MRYSTIIPSLLLGICLLQLAAAAGTISQPRVQRLEDILAADYERLSGRVRDVKRFFGLDGLPLLTGGAEHPFHIAYRWIPEIMKEYKEIFITRCPTAISPGEAKIWAEHKAFVLDAYLKWGRGEYLSAELFPYDKVAAFFGQFRDIYDAMLDQESFDVNSLNITELNRGSANASFEELFKQMEHQYFRGPVNVTQLEGCYWKVYTMHTDLEWDVRYQLMTRIKNEWKVLENATRLYQNFTGISRASVLERLEKELWAVDRHVFLNLDEPSRTESMWPSVYQQELRTAYLIASTTPSWNQYVVRVSIIIPNRPLSIYDKSPHCSSQIDPDGVHFLISRRHLGHGENETGPGTLTAMRGFWEEADVKLPQNVEEIFGSPEARNNLDGSMEKLSKKLGAEATNGDEFRRSSNMIQCLAVSKSHPIPYSGSCPPAPIFYQGSRWPLAMRYSSGIRSLLLGIFLLQIAAAVATISQPRVQRLPDILFADYERVRGRIRDVERFFGLDGRPQLKGREEHPFHIAYRWIPDIMREYKEIFVDRCPNPITAEEAKIWVEHKDFVLDAYLEWGRGEYPTGQFFPDKEVDGFFRQFRDIYEAMPNQELFDVKSLDIAELNKGSAEASFEELFKLMERQYFRGPVNTTQLESCYWKIYMMHNDLRITEEIRSRIKNEWQILEDATRLYANFTGISRAPELKRLIEDKWTVIDHMWTICDLQSTAVRFAEPR
ncbi:unnamed protein product, partial [Mesorhabditis spiculigera]